MIFYFLQTPLNGVQRLGAVLPDGASSAAAGAVLPPGPVSNAGGPKSGGGGRPGPQLEGRAHDVSVHGACLSFHQHIRVQSSLCCVQGDDTQG